MPQQMMIIGFAALAASITSQAPEPAGTGGAPAGTTETKYCMHVGPVTGNLAETIECWTRQEWAEQGVDVDKEWAKEGVRTIG